jgi:hypothetical protein
MCLSSRSLEAIAVLLRLIMAFVFYEIIEVNILILVNLLFYHYKIIFNIKYTFLYFMK